MKFRFLSLFAAVALVAACETAPEGAGGASGEGMSAEGSDVASVEPGSYQDFANFSGDRVFFGFDKYSLTDEAKATLSKQADWLGQYPGVSLVVEGHADERGTREYNLALGERRANSVKDFLVAEGVSADRIRTISYGEERPAVVGSNEWAWSQNRRGVTKFQ